jgi:hypothetical protein
MAVVTCVSRETLCGSDINLADVSRETCRPRRISGQTTNTLVNAVVAQRETKEPCRPDGGPIRWRLAHQQRPTGTEEPICGLHNRRWVGEAAGGDRIELSRQVCADLVHITRQHGDMARQLQGADRSSQQVGSRRTTLDHCHGEVTPSPGNHEGGETTTGAEVDQLPAVVGNQADEPICVLDRCHQRPLSDRAALLDRGQRGNQWGIVSHSPA